MYEIPLDKSHMPSHEEFFAYCGECGALFDEPDAVPSLPFATTFAEL